MPHLLVVGGVSLDTIHQKGQAITSAGGAGIFTAMAAIDCGVMASLFEPCPDPMPVELQEVARRLYQWLGPVVPACRLPRFEIHREDGKVNFFSLCNDLEGDITPDQLPSDLSEYDCVHITPMGSSELQQELIQTCRKNGASMISAGTYPCKTKENPESVRKAIDLSDLFFMNEEEAAIIFGSLDQVKTNGGKLIFVTLGENGAMILQGERQIKLPTKKVMALDPTGAGDTFCGAVLAHLLLGEDPIAATQKAMVLAGEEILEFGPAVLLRKDGGHGNDKL